MKTNFKKILTLTLAVILVLGCFAGCGKSGTEGGEKKPYEIVFVHPGDPANDMDVVLEEFYKQTQDTLNVKLSFIYAGWDDIGQKVSLKISGGEKMDSAFLAQWTSPSIQEAALDGQLLNLDKYFNNDQYPGLKAAFSEEYLSTNKFLGDDGEYHVYGIPFSNSFGNASYVFYRKDLADKYGVTINTVADLETFYDAILADGSGMTPLAFLGSQDQLMSAFYSETKTVHNYITAGNTNSGLLAGGVIIKDDGTAYVSRTFVAADDPEFNKYMPDDDRSKTEPHWEYGVARRFYEKGYVSEDILNTTDARADFMAGKAASFFGATDIYSSVASEFAENIPGGELGMIRVTNLDEPHQINATFQAWNFACIPVTCKDPDRVMEFYDWVYASQANNDLFELGIEGVHWNAVGDNGYEAIPNAATGNTYNFPGYLLTWNPTMTRQSASTPEAVLADIEKCTDQTYFYKEITAGFSFDSSAVKTEVALISDVVSMKTALGNGMVADIDGTIESLNQQLLAAGWEAYAAEYERQFNEYLKDHPYEGQ